MSAPYSNLDDKLTRAIAAYLRSVGIGTTDNIVSHLTNQPRVIPPEGLISVLCGDGDAPGDQPGNIRFPVTVMLKFPGIDDPNAAASAEIAARQRQAAINDKLLLSDDTHTIRYTAAQITAVGRSLAVSDGTEEGDTFAAENADMVDFTLIWWESTGFTTPTQEPAHFVSAAHFSALCCASNID